MDLDTLLNLSRLKKAPKVSIEKSMVRWYEEQIRRLYTIGIGNKTEFHTVVTEQLVSVYKRRLNELRRESYISPDFLGEKKGDANI